MFTWITIITAILSILTFLGYSTYHSFQKEKQQEKEFIVSPPNWEARAGDIYNFPLHITRVSPSATRDFGYGWWTPSDVSSTSGFGTAVVKIVSQVRDLNYVKGGLVDVAALCISNLSKGTYGFGRYTYCDIDLFNAGEDKVFNVTIDNTGRSAFNISFFVFNKTGTQFDSNTPGMKVGVWVSS